MKRQSNIDLLRILAMIFIIAHHFVIYAFDISTLDSSFSSWILHYMIMGGKLGVNIMMLLAGYFYEKSLHSKPEKIVSTYSQLWTYSIGVLLILGITGNIAFNFENIVLSVMPVSFEYWWFGSSYFLFLFLQPYLTKGLIALSEKEHRNVCLIIGFFWIIIPWIFDRVLFLTDFFWIMCVYTLGVYFKRTKFFENKNWKIFLLISFVFSIINLLIGMTGMVPTYFGMCKPFIVGMAITLVVAFVNMPMKENKWITFFASTNLGVYLIHDAYFMRQWFWVETLKLQNYFDSPFFLLYAIFVVLGVYLVCSFIEKIRENTLGKLTIKIYNRVLRYINLKKVNMK